MKARKQKVSAPAPTAPPAIPPWRRRLYKCLAVALPFLALLLLEAGLRLAGFGYPTDFFLEQIVEGRTMLVENPKFGWRFFPRAQARTPQPLRITPDKPPGTLRVVVLGESAAMGDPEPAYGLPRVLEVLLQEAYPTTRVEVINTAMTAINSHAIREIARDCRRLQADYWVIYMGNNEVVGPFGAGTVFGPRAPGLGFIRTALWLKTLKTGQLVEAAKTWFSRQPPRAWEGMELFLNFRLRASDPPMQVVYQNFEANLRDILEEAKRAQVKVIVCTVGANLKDCAPFASLHRPDLSPAEQAQFDQAMQAGIGSALGGNLAGTSLAASNHFWEATEKFEAALKLDPQFAEAHYRLAQCQWALGQFESARTSYQHALEHDVLRFRVDTRLNDITRQIAGKRTSEGIFFVDTAAALAQASPHQTPGRELFWEHVHLNFDGNYLLARSVARQMQKAGLSSPIAHTDWLSREAAARKLAFTDWDQFRVADQVRKRLQIAPFNQQLDHDAQMRCVDELLARLQPRASGAAMKDQTEVYRQAIAERPDDWVLPSRFADLLEEIGDLAAASEHALKAVRLLPHSAQAHFRLGNLLDKQGKTADALTHFEKAIQMNPGLAEALNGLGLCHLNLNQPDAAIAKFQAALRLKPDLAAARVNLARALSQQGRPAEAEAQYREALRLQSNNVAAHVNLGKLLRQQNRLDEALAHYQAAVQLKPADAVARFNLANALAEMKRYPEALTNYAAAVAAAPAFTEARLNFGLELARAGRQTEALEQLAEAVKLNPHHGDARLNYGVALARQRQLPQAREQFEAAAKLKPNDPAPWVNLGMVLAMQNRLTEAIQSYETALRLDPNHAQARKNLEQALAMKRQPER